MSKKNKKCFDTIKGSFVDQMQYISTTAETTLFIIYS